MDQRTTVLYGRLKALRGRYLSRLRERLAQVEDLSARLLTDGLDAASLETLRTLAHSMHGSAKTFDLPTLSTVAGELEERLSLPDGGASSPAALRACVARLRESIREP